MEQIETYGNFEGFSWLAHQLSCSAPALKVSRTIWSVGLASVTPLMSALTPGTNPRGHQWRSNESSSWLTFSLLLPEYSRYSTFIQAPWNNRRSLTHGNIYQTYSPGELLQESIFRLDFCSGYITRHATMWSGQSVCMITPSVPEVEGASASKNVAAT